MPDRPSTGNRDTISIATVANNASFLCIAEGFHIEDFPCFLTFELVKNDYNSIHPVD